MIEIKLEWMSISRKKILQYMYLKESSIINQFIINV